MKNPSFCERPCKGCPFLKEGGVSHLSDEKIKQISKSHDYGFICHELNSNGIKKQCAGYSILNIKEKTESAPFQIAERIGFFNRTELREQDKVVDTWEKFFSKHKH